MSRHAPATVPRWDLRKKRQHKLPLLFHFEGKAGFSVRPFGLLAVALHHFDTEFPLKLKNELPSFVRLDCGQL